jgi:hypothetical protein
MRVNAEEKEAIVVRVPSKTEILEKPYRAWFVCGGWIDSDAPNVVNVYWHRRQGRFTVFSLLQILEHEMLHAVLAMRVGLEVSVKLDSVHRSVFVLLDEEGERGIFVNELRNGEEWVFPPYLEEPGEDLLESKSCE